MLHIPLCHNCSLCFLGMIRLLVHVLPFTFVVHRTKVICLKMRLPRSQLIGTIIHDLDVLKIFSHRIESFADCWYGNNNIRFHMLYRVHTVCILTNYTFFTMDTTCLWNRYFAETEYSQNTPEHRILKDSLWPFGDLPWLPRLGTTLWYCNKIEGCIAWHAFSGYFVLGSDRSECLLTCCNIVVATML